MRRTTFVFVCCVALACFVVGGSASAASPKQPTCSGGAIAAGSYAGLTVTGTCTIATAVTINGNVKVADGAYLDAAYNGTRLTINGNVDVGKGAKLGLGCTFGYHDCGVSSPPPWFGRVTVNGNIVANQALTMYLDFTAIHGNVVSNGGGDITMVDGPNGGGIVFPIKDNVIDGNVVVHGWQGAWFGIIRNHIGGNVIASDTVGTRVDPDGAPDSTEIVTNQIAGNLICHGNTPATQIGDSGGTTNTVGGNKIGECALGGL